jgi:hypothetical protein
MKTILKGVSRFFLGICLIIFIIAAYLFSAMQLRLDRMPLADVAFTFAAFVTVMLFAKNWK